MSRILIQTFVADKPLKGAQEKSKDLHAVGNFYRGE